MLKNTVKANKLTSVSDISNSAIDSDITLAFLEIENRSNK